MPIDNTPKVKSKGKKQKNREPHTHTFCPYQVKKVWFGKAKFHNAALKMPQWQTGRVCKHPNKPNTPTLGSYSASQEAEDHTMAQRKLWRYNATQEVVYLVTARFSQDANQDLSSGRDAVYNTLVLLLMTWVVQKPYVAFSSWEGTEFIL